MQLVYGVGNPCILAFTVASERMSAVVKLQAILLLVAGGRLISGLYGQSCCPIANRGEIDWDATNMNEPTCSTYDKGPSLAPFSLFRASLGLH